MSDDADKRLTLLEIQLSAGRNQRSEDRRLDSEIHHRQIAPVGAEEWSHALLALSHAIADINSLRVGHGSEIGALRCKNPFRPHFVFAARCPWEIQLNEFARALLAFN